MRFCRAGGLAAAALVLAACARGPAPSSDPATPALPVTTGASATASNSPTTSGSPSSGDWFTYHRTNDRTGYVPGGTRPRHLSTGWTARLDGAVYGQPLVIGDLVIAATEGDSVYGLDLRTGAVRWQRRVGTPMARRDLHCGNIDPLGITGTPVYDPGTGSVFVVAETTGARHDLVSLDAGTGVVRFTRALDISGRDQHAEQQRGALAVANGRVYVPFGGLAGDCGNYVGYVSATDVRGRGASLVYQVPTRRQGGIWAPSGVAVSASGDIWVAVGNGASFENPYDGSDSVLRLSPDLRLRRDFFAPSNWGSENAEDADLGSTGPMLIGAATEQVMVSGKNSQVYLLDAAHLGGIGGQRAQLGDCRGFGGLAFDPAAGAAFVPCTEGLLRVDVRGGTLRRGWQADERLNGSPVVGGGTVWALDQRSGRLHALSEATGSDLTSVSVGDVSRFASPVLTGQHVLVPTLAGVTSVTAS